MAVVKNGMLFFLLSKLLAAIADHSSTGNFNSIHLREQPLHGYHGRYNDHLQMHQPLDGETYYNNYQHHQSKNYERYNTEPQPYDTQNQVYYQPMPPPQVDQMQQSNALLQPLTGVPQMAQPNLMALSQPRALDESNSNNGFFQLPNFLNSISNLISPNPTNENSQLGSPAANPQYSEPQAQQPNQPQLSQSYSPPQSQIQQLNDPLPTTNPTSQNQPTYSMTPLSQQPQSFSSPQNVEQNQNQYSSVTNGSPSSLPLTAVNTTELQLPSQSDLQENTNNSQSLNEQPSSTINDQTLSTKQVLPSQQTETEVNSSTQNHIEPPSDSSLSQQQSQPPQSSFQPQNIKEEELLSPTTLSKMHHLSSSRMSSILPTGELNPFLRNQHRQSPYSKHPFSLQQPQVQPTTQSTQPSQDLPTTLSTQQSQDPPTTLSTPSSSQQSQDPPTTLSTQQSQDLPTTLSTQHSQDPPTTLSTPSSSQQSQDPPTTLSTQQSHDPLTTLSTQQSQNPLTTLSTQQSQDTLTTLSAPSSSQQSQEPPITLSSQQSQNPPTTLSTQQSQDPLTTLSTQQSQDPLTTLSTQQSQDPPTTLSTPPSSQQYKNQPSIQSTSSSPQNTQNDSPQTPPESQNTSDFPPSQLNVVIKMPEKKTRHGLDRDSPLSLTGANKLHPAKNVRVKKNPANGDASPPNSSANGSNSDGMSTNPPIEPAALSAVPPQQGSDIISQPPTETVPGVISGTEKSVDTATTTTTVENVTPQPVVPVEPESKVNAFASMENKEFDAPEVYDGLAAYDSSYNVNTEDEKHGKEDTDKMRLHADANDIHILNLPPLRQSSSAYFSTPNPTTASTDSSPNNSLPYGVRMPFANLKSASKDDNNYNNNYSNNYPPRFSQYAPQTGGRRPIVPQIANDDGPTGTSGSAYVPIDLKNPPPHPTSWSMINHDYPSAGGGPTEPQSSGKNNANNNNNYFNNNNINSPPSAGGRNPTVSAANDDRPTDTSGPAYVPIDLKNPPPHPTSWSMINHDYPTVGGGPTDSQSSGKNNANNNNNYYFNNNNNSPPSAGGRNPTVSAANDDRSTDTSGYSYLPIDLKNPPPHPTSWSMVNHDYPTASNNNNNYYPPPPPPPPQNVNYGGYPSYGGGYQFNGAGGYPSNGAGGYQSNGDGYYPRPQQQQNNGYYGTSPNVPGGYYNPGIPPAFDRNYNNVPYGYGPPPPQQIPPYGYNAFAENMISAISNALQTPVQGTRAVFDVTRSNFPNMPEAQQINLTYAVVQAATVGLRNILDSFINRLFDNMQRVKRGFDLKNVFPNMVTGPDNALGNYSGTSGKPTGNNYRSATTTTNTPSYYSQQMPAVKNLQNVGLQSKPNGGFGTPQTNYVNPRGLIADVLTEDVKKTIYTNLPEPYKYDSPQVARYIQQLSLVLATVFQNQINEVLRGNASNIS